MKKAAISLLGAAVCLIISTEASAQRFALKAYDNIGVGKTMSLTESQPGQTSSSNYNAFGIDFGYTFWRQGASSLEANIGLGYSSAGLSFAIPEMEYSYAAPAAADEDGNPYQRYYRLTDLKQKSSVGYFTIPIYLDYQYRPISWLGIHALVGFNLGFRCAGSVGKVSGMSYSYGVFPEYDDLLIDESYLDDFGERNLNGSAQGEPTYNGFYGAVTAGLGFEFYAYEPVSFEVGIRYNVGLTHSFSGKYQVNSTGDYTAETAPVTYTVAGGTHVKSLTDYTTASKLSPLSIHVGVNVRF